MDINLEVNIENDLLRFSKLHLWYKHLSFEGKEFLIFPWKGQQPKNYFDPQVEDSEGLHWWFWYADFIDEIPLSGRGKEIVMQNSVNFNCFLRGLENDCTEEKNNCEGFKNLSTSYFRGWHLINRRHPGINGVLMEIYPEAKGNTDTYVDLERNRQLQRADHSTRNIFKLMRNECPDIIGLSLSWKSDMRILIPNLPKKENSVEEITLPLVNPPLLKRGENPSFTNISKEGRSLGKTIQSQPPPMKKVSLSLNSTIPLECKNEGKNKDEDKPIKCKKRRPVSENQVTLLGSKSKASPRKRILNIKRFGGFSPRGGSSMTDSPVMGGSKGSPKTDSPVFQTSSENDSPILKNIYERKPSPYHGEKTNISPNMRVIPIERNKSLSPKNYSPIKESSTSSHRKRLESPLRQEISSSLYKSEYSDNEEKYSIDLEYAPSLKRVKSKKCHSTSSVIKHSSKQKVEKKRSLHFPSFNQK